MNDLQNLLLLRGITAAQIAEATGIGYHAIQKTILGQRKGQSPRKAIADYLGVPVDEIWGVTSTRTIKHMILEEIDLRVDAERNLLRERYLATGTLANARTRSNV